MSLIILKRDTPVWYAKKDGQLLPMLNRGRQIQRISKREGHFSWNFLDWGSVQDFMDVQTIGQDSYEFQQVFGFQKEYFIHDCWW